MSPAQPAPAAVDRPERFTVETGAFRGAQAELLVVPRGIPHVWALGDSLVVTSPET